MSVKICTTDDMLSTVVGTDMARSWFPRIVAEVYLESTIDGEIKRSPDSTPMITGALSWFNNSDTDQQATVEVLRAPRTVVAQSPTTVLIHDAWTWAIGVNPSAEYPSVSQDASGGRAQIDRPEAGAADLLYGRLFLDSDSSMVLVDVGVIPAQEVIHFRYMASVQTPGTWITPSEFDPRWEAYARWTRLLLHAEPVGQA